MRPERFLRQPFPRAQAHRRHALRTPLRPLQNQLERGPMTGIGARLGVAAEGRSLRRPLRVRGLSLALIAVCALLLGAVALMGGGSIEPVILGVLALLAVGGVFLIFGLLSGLLRLSDRVAEAEMVKAVADGLDSGLEIVAANGRVLYRNRALKLLTGRRSGRQGTLEELLGGEPQSAQAFFRLHRAP